MIDLKSLAHELRWRVSLDPSDSQSPRSERPWLYRVDGKRGHVCVWGENQLAACCGTGYARRDLLAVPGSRLIRDGDKEAIIAFPTDQLDAVCRILKARKRKVLTPEQRERLAIVGAKGVAAFRERGTQSDFPAPGSIGEGSDVVSIDPPGTD